VEILCVRDLVSTHKPSNMYGRLSLTVVKQLQFWLKSDKNTVSRVCGDCIRRVLGRQLDLLGHTQLQCIHSYSSLQFTKTIAESSHCIFTGCLSSNIAGSVRLQLCNSSLKTAARPEYSLVTNSITVSQSQSRVTTDGQPVSQSWCRPPSGAHDQMLRTVRQLRFCPINTQAI
jgi:hypothetical protein